MELEYPKCSHCGNPGYKTLINVRDIRHGFPGDFEIVECTECSLRYLRPRPTRSAIGAFYPPSYVAHKKDPEPSSGLAKALSAVSHAYLRFFLSDAFPTYFYEKHAGRFKPPGRRPRLLDVGCGNGNKLAFIKKSGWKTYGVDSSERAVLNACAAGVDCAEKADGSNLPFESNHFDAVMSWHSLEHHHNPAATLQEMLRVLRPGGYGIIAVPSGNTIGLRLFGANWGPLEAPRHLYYFTEQTLAGMCRQAGFEVLKCYYDMTFYGLFLHQEIYESLENVAASFGLKLRIPRVEILNTILRAIVLPFNNRLGRMWRGGNLIMHTQKPN